MRHLPVVFEAVSDDEHVIDRIVDALLIVMLLAVPAMLGGPALGNFSTQTDLRFIPALYTRFVFPFGETMFVWLSMALMVCVALRLIVDRGFSLVRSWAYWPMGLFIALMLLQVMPLPASVVAMLSPSAARLRSELTPDLQLPTQTLSLYAELTIQNLRVILGLIAVFVTVLAVYRRPWHMQRLLIMIGLVAAFYASIAVYHQIIGSRRLMGVLPISIGAQGGPLVNRNNWAQFANIGLGAIVALMLYRIRRGTEGGRLNLRDLRTAMGDADVRLVGVLLVLAIVVAISSVLTLSRGGAISLGAGLILTCILLSLQSGQAIRGWLFAGIGVVIALAALLVGAEAFLNRVGTLGAEGELERSRLELIRSVLGAFADFPAVGSGLGSFPVVFPMYDQTGSGLVADHADSDWAQLLMEGGIVGFALAVWFAGMVLLAWWKMLRGRAGSASAIAAGLGIGFVAIVLHSAADLGQHLPAVAMLTACISAMLINLPASRRSRDNPQPAGPVMMPRRFGIALTALLMIGMGWASVDALRASLAEREFIRAYAMEQRLRNLDWLGTDDEYRQLLGPARRAFEMRPGNAHYRYWHSVYAVQYLEAGRDAQTGRLQFNPAEVVQVRDGFDAVRRLAPTFGPAHSSGGDLRRRYLNDTAGDAMVRIGRRLSPGNADAAVAAGAMELDHGNIPDAIAAFTQAATVEPAYRTTTARLLRDADQHDAALAIARASIESLDALRASYADDQTTHRAAIDRATKQLLIDRAAAGSLSGAQLARLGQMHRDDNEPELAASRYREALRRDPANTNWRWSLALALHDAGDVDGSLDEAQRVADARPTDASVRDFIAALRAPATRPVQ
jgi:tetratricopeptide (TPR) repeat protein/O-antigen ligase